MIQSIYQLPVNKLLLLPALLAATLASATTTAYSPPVGGVTITLVGGNAKVTTFSPALRMPVGSNFVGKVFGTLTNVTSTTLSDSTAGWSASALSQASTPYFIHILTGTAVGTWWQISTSVSTPNTSTVVTVLNRGGISALTAGVTAGDSYQIVPADTLGNFFANVIGSIGDINATLADQVQLYNGSSWQTYFYNSSAGGWRLGALPVSQNNVIIPPDSGVIYTRNHSGDISLLMLGAVATQTEQILVPSTGITIVGNVFPVARTLGSLSLNSLSGFVPYSGSLTACDLVQVYTGTTWQTFNYSSGHWHIGLLPISQDAFAIPFGAPIVFIRGTAATGEPNLLTLTPPYNL